MNYQESLDYMMSNLPMFQRVGASAYKSDLNNIIELMEALNNPHLNFRSIHVGGTNGKGSTSHFLASILQEKGLKVGLHTSPHLKDFRERIRIQGEVVPEAWVASFISKHKSLLDHIQPSFFEMAVAMAFQYFSEQHVDIAIIEVGMGGRLDSTNILHPLLSIITNISLDHTQFLGSTLPEIAQEKAGIIKENTPIIIGETQATTASVFREKAQMMHAPISFADQIFRMENLSSGVGNLSGDLFFEDEIFLDALDIPLTGEYQIKNILTTCAAVLLLNDLGFKLSKSILRKGIANVIQNTHLMGRWQIVSHRPLIIFDTGHNEEGIRQVLYQIAKTPHQNLHFVLSMVNDKDIDKILCLLPKDATYYLAKANIPRGLDVDLLAEKVTSNGFHSLSFPSVKDALEKAKENADAEDMILVGGSTFTVSECF